MILRDVIPFSLNVELLQAEIRSNIPILRGKRQRMSMSVIIVEEERLSMLGIELETCQAIALISGPFFPTIY